MEAMKRISHDDVAREVFPGGATYQTLVGDDAGSTPIRLGIQISPPGYATPDHAHPYVEVITVLEGRGEAWSADGGIATLEPGVSLVVGPGIRHGFRVIGAAPLKTLGIHASPHRIVDVAAPGNAVQLSGSDNSPSASLGSNQVDFGGITPPASATAKRSASAVG